MNYLYDIGINKDELDDIISENNNIIYLSDSDIYELICLFVNIGFDTREIKEMIVENASALNRSVSDIIKLIRKLKEIGVEDIKELFLSNPWLLNMDDFEIDNFIENKLNDGVDSCDILEMLCRGDIW